MKTYRLSVVVEKDEEGYFAFCPDLQGCYTQGQTLDEALDNIRDAIRLHIIDRVEAGEDVKLPELVSVASIEVTV